MDQIADITIIICYLGIASCHAEPVVRMPHLGVLLPLLYCLLAACHACLASHHTGGPGSFGAPQAAAD